MNSDPPFSNDFQRLYCDPGVFDPFSVFHPISFKRVLPFRLEDPVVDDLDVIHAEEAHVAGRSDDTRRDVIDAYCRCGLLTEDEAANVKSVIDYFDADFFDLMGQVYANAGMFICALRWYREFLRELETANPNSHPDADSVCASVGYCLHSLGLFEEAIAWSKSCIGLDPTVDAVCRALLEYEVQPAGGTVVAVERAGSRARYTVSAADSERVIQAIPRLKTAMAAFIPFRDIYIDVVPQGSMEPELEPDGYPFRVERDSRSLPRHKMNLIFATCGQADALLERGYVAEAKRLLLEAAMLEPAAEFVRERIEAMP